MATYFCEISIYDEELCYINIRHSASDLPLSSRLHVNHNLCEQRMLGNYEADDEH